MRLVTVLKSAVPLLVLTVFAAGCGGGDKVLAPQFQPEVVNTPNATFSFQATGLTGITDVVAYTWNCSSGSLIIHPSTATTSGTLTLNIKDAGGNVVYNGPVPASGDITPPNGTPGAWAIRVSLVQFSGTINFAVQMQ